MDPVRSTAQRQQVDSAMRTSPQGAALSPSLLSRGHVQLRRRVCASVAAVAYRIDLPVLTTSLPQSVYHRVWMSSYRCRRCRLPHCLRLCDRQRQLSRQRGATRHLHLCVTRCGSRTHAIRLFLVRHLSNDTRHDRQTRHDESMTFGYAMLAATALRVPRLRPRSPQVRVYMRR